MIAGGSIFVGVGAERWAGHCTVISLVKFLNKENKTELPAVHSLRSPVVLCARVNECSMRAARGLHTAGVSHHFAGDSLVLTRELIYPLLRLGQPLL